MLVTNIEAKNLVKLYLNHHLDVNESNKLGDINLYLHSDVWCDNDTSLDPDKVRRFWSSIHQNKTAVELLDSDVEMLNDYIVRCINFINSNHLNHDFNDIELEITKFNIEFVEEMRKEMTDMEEYVLKRMKGKYRWVNKIILKSSIILVKTLGFALVFSANVMSSFNIIRIKRSKK